MSFENEIESVEEQSVSSDGNEASSEPRAESSPEAAQKAVPETTEDTSKLPFNDPRSPQHDRFKELMEQRNEERQARSRLEKQLEDLTKRFEESSKPKPQENPLLARLKGIDPEFGEWAAKQEASAQELAQLREWRAQQERATLVSQYEAGLSKLHADNKVSPELQQRYNRELEATIRANPQLTLNDLPRVYKSVHEEYTKLLEGVRRAEREAYVKGKSQDTNVPTSQPKGKAVQHGKQPEWSGNKEQDRATLIARALKLAKANDSI